MIKWLESRILWGVILILIGIVYLLQNLGIFQVGDLFWTIAFGLAGILFLSIALPNRANWWAFIPGFTLLSIGLLIFLDRVAPALSQVWGGTIILGGIALSFVVIYIAERSNWWAVIPAGVLLTLAMVAGLSSVLTGTGTGGIFFMGMGLTFAFLAVLPNPDGRMKWAWIPAGVLFLMGLLILAAAEALIGYLWPAALILAGLYLIYRTFTSWRRS